MTPAHDADPLTFAHGIEDVARLRRMSVRRRLVLLVLWLNVMKGMK
jgi:hypothetical protein